MGITSSMGTNKLYIRKGDRNTWVDYTGTLDSTAATAQVVAGRVFSLTAGGKLEPGIAVARIPYFAMSGLDANNAPDVLRTKGMPRSGQVQFATLSPFAAVEAVTTSFIPESTYTPGLALTASSNATTTRGVIGLQVAAQASATFGGLTFTSLATSPVVGYVAPAGKFTDVDGNVALAFYPAYVAGTTVATLA